MSTNRKAGTLLIVASITTAIAMLFHPTGRDVIAGGGTDYGNSMDVGVHLIAIVGEIALLLGALALTADLARQRDVAVTAFVVYGVAIFSLVIAAVASGLIAPGIASHIAHADGAERDALSATFTFNGHVNQAFAKLGFGLAAIAIALWSWAMRREGYSTGLAWFGLISGTLVVFALLVIRSSFVLHGVGGLVIGSQLAWSIWTGAALRQRPAGGV